MNELIELNTLQERIFTIRGKRVMIDRDLAELYGVKTMVLNQAVKRNIKRFPANFMFKLNGDEFKELITNCDRLQSLKHSPTTPYAFTEHGVTMLSSVLNSDRAIEISVKVVEAFIALRQFTLENKELARRLSELENYFVEHCEDNRRDNEETRQHLTKIYEAIGLLMDRTKPTQIGFKCDD